MRGIAVDNAGFIYIAAYASGNQGGSTSFGAYDMFLLKYSSSNNTKQWTRLLGTSSDEYVYGVETDSLNNIYVIGDTMGNFDGINKGGKDIFLVKYNFSGVKQWVRQLGSNLDETPTDLAIGYVDGKTYIYLVGYTKGALDGNANLGESDFFIAKYDSEGNLQKKTYKVTLTVEGSSGEVCVEIDKWVGCGGNDIKYSAGIHNISVKSGGSIGFEIQTPNNYTYKITNSNGSISTGSSGINRGPKFSNFKENMSLKIEFISSDKVSPSVSNIIPNDSTDNVSLNSPFEITFNEAIDTTTIITNNNSTECSGSIQLSKNNFTNCTPLSSNFTTSNSNKTIRISPVLNLDNSSIYKIKINNSVKDLAGNLLNQYTSSKGFLTKCEKIIPEMFL